MGCLYFAQTDDVHPIHGGRIISAMFGHKSVPPVTDVSIYTDDSTSASGIWYGRVSEVYAVQHCAFNALDANSVLLCFFADCDDAECSNQRGTG